MRIKWKEVAYLAAAELYKHEVLYPFMEDLVVGDGKEFSSKNDWINQKVQELIEAIEGDTDDDF